MPNIIIVLPKVCLGFFALNGTSDFLFASFASKKIPPPSAKNPLEPLTELRSVGFCVPHYNFLFYILKMPKAGLEPAWISPYAPETHVSTIPPLRHLLNCDDLSGGRFRFAQTLSSNDTQSFSSAEYHFGIFNFVGCVYTHLVHKCTLLLFTFVFPEKFFFLF